LSCALAGAYKTCKQFEEAFDCKVGSTSDDGLVGLEYVECHADCGRAPVVMIGEKEYTGIKTDEANELIEKIKNGTVDTE
jgi:NADH-quinone oxidoreductase subunit E